MTRRGRGRTVVGGTLLAGAAAGVAAVVAAAVLLDALPVIRWLSARSPEVFFHARTREPLVALTIDDAPSAATPAILDVLAAHRVPATFFVIGEQVATREAALRRMAAEGHELGNHLMRDEPSARLAPDAFEADLLRTRAVLAPYGASRWFRPGSGWYTRAMLARARRHGYRCALGSVYPFDPHLPFRRYLIRTVLARTRPGSVIVLHDGEARGLRTADVLRAVIPELRRRGFRFVTLSALAAADTVARGRP